MTSDATDDPALTGLGLFTRHPTADAHPTAIAVNLGLKAAGSQAERPWACRISTPLARPAADGLARDVHEIERLATVAGATLRGLAPQAVFAAAVTANGTRTWLMYAAGSDAAATLATVRAAAASAFAAQPGYVPTVTVEADPEWSGYRSLYPTKAEVDAIRRGRLEATAITAARTATKSTVQSLRAAGVDLARLAEVRYTASLPNAACRGQLSERASAFGLRTVNGDIGPDGSALLHLVRADLPDLAIVLRTERWLIHEAHRLGGQYQGWAVEAEAPAAAA